MSTSIEETDYAEHDRKVPTLQNVIIDFDEKFGSKTKQIPASGELFHYTDMAGLFGIVSTGQLFASNVLFLNDRSEAFFARRVSEKAIRHIETGITNALGKQFIEMLRKLVVSYQSPSDTEGGFALSMERRSHDVYVVSLCEERDLLSQWRGYSGNGVGHSIGLDIIKLERNLQSFELTPIIYDSTLQAEIAEFIILKSLAYLAKGDFDAFPVGQFSKENIALNVALWTLQNLDYIGLRFKDAGFKEENEWRLIDRMPRVHHGSTGLPFKTSPPVVHQDGSPLVSFRVRGGQLVPFRKFMLRTVRDMKPGFQDDANPISSVTVGPGNDFEKTKHAIEFLFAYYGMPLETHRILTSGIPYAPHT